MGQDILENARLSATDSESFLNQLKELILKYGLCERIQPFIETIQKRTSDYLKYNSALRIFFFDSECEELLFKTLLGTVETGKILTKYTSANALEYLCDNSIGMCSVVGMNDTKECSYVSDYLNRCGISKLFNEKEEIVELGTATFITSFTNKKDDLTMWRLYGNDSKGIALHFSVDQELKGDFILAKVNYAQEDGRHPELDFIADLEKVKENECHFSFRQLYKWMYFFKPFDYKVEEEIRLLYHNSYLTKDTKWITSSSGVLSPIVSFPIWDESSLLEESPIIYPLTLHGITLGPQYEEKEINVGLVEKRLRTRFGWLPEDVPVKTSVIKNYKNS